MENDNRNERNERSDRNDRHDREPNRNWWWLAIPGLLLLGLLMFNPMSRDNTPTPNPNSPTPISDRGPTSDVPMPGTPINDNNSMTPGNNNMGTQAQLNERVTSAAKSVDGVRDAWAVTTPIPNTSSTTGMDDTFALVGVNLESSIKGAAEESTRNDIEAAVKNIPDIDQVVVSSAPSIVNRIKKVSEDITAGKPATTLESDMNAIIKDLVPSASR